MSPSSGISSSDPAPSLALQSVPRKEQGCQCSGAYVTHYHYSFPSPYEYEHTSQSEFVVWIQAGQSRHGTFEIWANGIQIREGETVASGVDSGLQINNPPKKTLGATQTISLMIWWEHFNRSLCGGGLGGMRMRGAVEHDMR
jgi:hypothetical protein